MPMKAFCVRHFFASQRGNAHNTEALVNSSPNSCLKTSFQRSLSCLGPGRPFNSVMSRSQTGQDKTNPAIT